MSASSQLTSPQISKYDSVEQDPWPARARRVTQLFALGLTGLLIAVGVLFSARRMWGSLVEELPPHTMLITAVVTTALATFSRIAWRRIRPVRQTLACGNNWTDQFVGWGTSIGLLLVAVGCCYPAYHNSDWLIWLPMLVADQFWRQSYFDAGKPGSDLEIAEVADVATTPLTIPFPIATESNEEVTADSQEIVQQLYRVRSDDGQELIYGTLRADFHPGQRTAVLHVGFCPPLPYLPEIEADPLPSSSARLKVVQAMAHGARLDVRLSEIPDTDCHLWIDMSATPVQSA